MAVGPELRQHYCWWHSEVTVANRRLRCAGINRHEAEDESSLRERSSDPLGLESCAGYREVPSEA